MRSLFHPFTVRSTDYRATHHCSTFADAIAWASCYPAADVVSIHRRGILVSIRHGS